MHENDKNKYRTITKARATGTTITTIKEITILTTIPLKKNHNKS